LSACVKKKEHL